MLENINKKFTYLFNLLARLSKSIWRTATFAFLLFFYLAANLIGFFAKLVAFSDARRENIREKISESFERVGDFIGKVDTESIKRTQLIDLSIRNMRMRKTRTTITIGGMMVGIGAIVFLVSIGYGLQDLVISRVAKLEEMKQATVMIQSGSREPLNDETVAHFKEVANVETVLPVISVVGRVNFNDSVSDMAVYGVTSEYLKKSDIKTTVGAIFDSNELTKTVATRIEEGSAIKNKVPALNDQNSTNNGNAGDILANDGLKYNDKGELVMVDDGQKNQNVKKVSLEGDVKSEAVVNQAMIRILGINESVAVGQKFSTAFVLVGKLSENNDSKIEAVPVEYEIVGVVPEGKTPMFYVPFINLRSLGVTNYSQMKISVTSPDTLLKARQQIEAMGYKTNSVADTVDQINSLFSTARIILALVGMVALGVASLGMFNTLTVSLLERTREVGLMKAMGMKSDEVHELFLTESMIMGFLGGALGIVLGFLLGKLMGAALSFFSVIQGAGMVNVSSIPVSLIFAILALSLFVGIVTGIYPARRAEKISALNALRYE